MMNRFQGPNGLTNRVAALKKNVLVEHNEEIADQLVAHGELLAVKAGDVIVTQDGSERDVFFLLTGQAEVLIQNRRVAVRGSGEVVGEMALIDPLAPRSATVKALKAMVILKVDETDFHQIADKHPQIWKTLAQMLGEKLRQRGLGIVMPNIKPRLFLGCAAESLPIAEEIQLGLARAPIDVAIWSNGVFGPSQGSMEALLEEVDKADFAAFLFSPDDKTVSRKRRYDAPRDNVVFELGLFMGRLDLKRTFVIKEGKTDIKIPSDFLGITPLTYHHPEGAELRLSIATVCTELKQIIANLGTR